MKTQILTRGLISLNNKICEETVHQMFKTNSGMEIAHLQTVNQPNSSSNKSTDRLRICALPHRHFEHTYRHASENRIWGSHICKLSIKLTVRPMRARKSYVIEHTNWHASKNRTSRTMSSATKPGFKKSSLWEA